MVWNQEALLIFLLACNVVKQVSLFWENFLKKHLTETLGRLNMAVVSLLGKSESELRVSQYYIIVKPSSAKKHKQTKEKKEKQTYLPQQKSHLNVSELEILSLLHIQITESFKREYNLM